MKTLVRFLILGVVSLLALISCDVHEFPKDHSQRVPFLLHLDFDTEMPFYKEITYIRNGVSKTVGVEADHDLRYTVKVYRNDNVRSGNRVSDTTYIFTKSDLSDLSYVAELMLPEGEYYFQVWTDYVDHGSYRDLYYNTSDFSEIILADREHHSGSNHYRDAFRGYATATVINPSYYTGEVLHTVENQAHVEMRRPMGKYKFVSTDVEAFLARVVQMIQESGSQESNEEILQNINLSDFKVVFRYNLFMPCSFNMFTDKPADSWTGVNFESQMYIETENEMTLGYDYIFVNGSETTLSISLEVYYKDGRLMSATNPIDVPIVRSKMTLVKGEFLTSEASEGVNISPDFDGEFNLEIH